MRKIVSAVVLGGTAALLISGCGTHHHAAGAAKADVSAVASAPQFQAAQKVVSTCYKMYPFRLGTRVKVWLTAMESCAAGKGSVASLKTCAESAVVKDKFLIRKRARLEFVSTDLPRCIVQAQHG